MSSTLGVVVALSTLVVGDCVVIVIRGGRHVIVDVGGGGCIVVDAGDGGG